MPGLMIALALVLAPAVDSGLKDPWADAPGARPTAERHEASTGERAELRNPFRSQRAPSSGDLRNPFDSHPPAGRSAAARDEDPSPRSQPRSGDLKDPFDAPRPSPPQPSSADLKDPFDDHRPPPADRGALVDPFQSSTGKRVAPSSTRADSLELRNPFAPRPRRRAR